MSIVLKNNAASALSQGINNSQTSIDVLSGAVFPNLSAGEYFYATIESTESVREIVKVTNVAGNTLTVVRAQDGTSAASFAEGSRVEARINATSVEDYVDQNAELSQYNQGDGSAVVRTIQSKLQETVSVKDFGAVEGQPSADAIQAAVDYILSIGSGKVEINGNFPIEKPINVGPRTGTHRTGIVTIDGCGGRIYKHSSFTGDRLLNIRLASSDEDYLTVQNLFIDGVGRDVNGADTFDDDIAYNALTSAHEIGDSSYDKAVNFIDVCFERCYRGLRHSGNSTRFFGCIFRDNICGEFRVSASNDISFFGCSFRRNQFGSHIATSNSSHTTVGGTYTGCIWESNSVIGIFVKGAGNQTFVNPYFESNGTDLTKADYLDKPSALDTVSTNFYQESLSGFANFNQIINGQSVGGGSTTTDVYLTWARNFTITGFRGDVISTGSVRSAVFSNAGTRDITGGTEGESLTVSGVKSVIKGGVPRGVGEEENVNEVIIRGSRLSSAGTQTVLEWEVPVANVSYVIEVTAFCSRASADVRNSRFEKKYFFVNRNGTSPTNVFINNASSDEIVHTGPDTGAASSVGTINLALARTGAEATTEPQTIGLSADIAASGAFATCSFEVRFRQNGSQPMPEIVTNLLS